MRVGPFAQAGLDEAFGFAIGFRRIGLGADVAQAEASAGAAECEGLKAGAVVGHHALDRNTEAGVVGERGFKESDGAALFLVRHDLGEGHARMIVDADVDVLPADAAAAALASAVASDAVADLIEDRKSVV